MHPGKVLRLRRLFANGRALIGSLDHGSDATAAAVRQFAQFELDAVALYPGMLERVAEELGLLSVILRLDSPRTRSYELLTVQRALELGADAVMLSVSARDSSELQRLARAATDAQPAGMPVIADVLTDDLRLIEQIASEFSVDVIQVSSGGQIEELHELSRRISQPLVLAPGRRDAMDLLRTVDAGLNAGMRGALLQCTEPDVLGALRSIAHQGSTLNEALREIA